MDERERFKGYCWDLQPGEEEMSQRRYLLSKGFKDKQEVLMIRYIARTKKRYVVAVISER